MRPPATEEEICAAEAKIGQKLPSPLRELYAFGNGGWTTDLNYLPLERDPERLPWEGLTDGTEEQIALGYRITDEVRLFAGDGGGDLFGLWMPRTERAFFENPVIHLAHELLDEDGCLGIVGTNLTSFLLRRSVSDIEEVHDRGPEQLKREEEARKILQVPWQLCPDGVLERYKEYRLDGTGLWRYEFYSDEVRKWADPHLPSEFEGAYENRFSMADLRRILA